MKFPFYTLLLFAAIALPLRAQEIAGPTYDLEEYEGGQKAAREYQERLREAGMNGATIRAAWQSARARMEPKHGATLAAAPAWEFIGPRNQAGRMKGLAVAKKDTALWYSAADGGGVWRSTNSGGTWTPLTDTLPSLRMSTLSMSPHDDELLLAGTHEGMIYRTSDGGARWSVIDVPGIGFIYDLKFDPITPTTVWLAAEGGVARSGDAGETWTVVRKGGRATSLSIDQTNPKNILYGQNSTNGKGRIYRTTDGGEQWKMVLERTVGYWERINVRIAPSDPSVAYCSYNGGKGTFYKSLDSGATWDTLAGQPYRDGYHRGYDVFEISPLSPDILIAGGTSLYRTTDGGLTWQGGDTVNKNLHVDQHAFLFPPHLEGTFIAGNDGGIYRTSEYSDDNLRWTMLDNDLVTLQIYNCAIHPTRTDTVIVGCQDNGYDKFSGDEYKWKVVGGDGFCTIYDYENPGYFYHEYIYHNLHRADDGFNWWSAKKMKGLPTDTSKDGFYSGFTDPDRADWYGQAIAISPNDPKTLYIGSNKLYRTDDRAENWRPVATREFAANQYDVLTAIKVTEGAAPQVYLGTNAGKLYRVVEGGDSAESFDITPSFGAIGRIRSILSLPEALPQNPATIWVGGDGGWQNKGVMASTNSGATWTVRSEGLPTGGVNRLLADPDSAGTLYAGTSFGLFFTRDNGQHWSAMPGFPNVEVWDFSFDRKTRTLLVGTYGRGAIRAQGFIPPPAPPLPLGVPAAAESTNHISVITSPAGQTTIRVTLEKGSRVDLGLFNVVGERVATLHSGELGSGVHEFAIGEESGVSPSLGVILMTTDNGQVQNKSILFRR